MAEFTESIVIDRPIDEVFDFATDLERGTTWIKGVTRLELIGAEKMEAGCRFRETRRMGKREHTAEIECRAHERPRRHVAGAGMMGVDAVYDYRFTEEGEGRTRVDLHARVEAKSFLGRFFVPLVMGAIRKTDANQLENLKRAIEDGVDVNAELRA